MKQNSKVYLAIPYTWNPELSFQIVNKVAAKLLRDGEIVYSPISHSHSIAKDNNLPGSWDFWSKLDQEFIKWADKLIVVVIENNGMSLINESKGVQAELKLARELGKEIEYYKVEPDKIFGNSDTGMYCASDDRLMISTIDENQIKVIQDVCSKLEVEKFCFSTKSIPFSIVLKTMEEEGFTHLSDEWDQNGWEVDYWTKFKKDDLVVNVSGSLYYGNVTIERYEEEEN